MKIDEAVTAMRSISDGRLAVGSVPTCGRAFVCGFVI